LNKLHNHEEFSKSKIQDLENYKVTKKPVSLVKSQKELQTLEQSNYLIGNETFRTFGYPDVSHINLLLTRANSKITRSNITSTYVDSS
jgi:hypothetical protein